MNKQEYKAEMVKRFGTRAVEIQFSEIVMPDGKKLDKSLLEDSAFIRQLSGDEIMDILADWQKMNHAEVGEDGKTATKLNVDIGDEKTRSMQSDFIARCQVTPDNERVWEDGDECGKTLRFGVIQALFLAGLQINGIGKTAQEEIEGN